MLASKIASRNSASPPTSDSYVVRLNANTEATINIYSFEGLRAQNNPEDNTVAQNDTNKTTKNKRGGDDVILPGAG